MIQKTNNPVQMSSKRGAPLVLLGALAVVWIAGRAAVWESPFPNALSDYVPPSVFADAGEVSGSQNPETGYQATLGSAGTSADGQFIAASFQPNSADQWRIVDDGERFVGQGPYASRATLSGAHHLLLRAAYGSTVGTGSAFSGDATVRPAGGSPRAAPRGSDIAANPASLLSQDRWKFDAFAFYRAGSGGGAISAGRVAIYGASQTGARLQYRFLPTSRHDPRGYVRAYKAMISGGESEIAAGVSARPLPSIPLRAFAEVRLTDTPLFGQTVRPAAYAVTELPPVKLPLNTSFELYGGAGYVGGVAATPFADGQAVAASELARFKLVGDAPLRLSMGAGAWGGVQRDAGRLDVGPTMRLDFDLGEIPARVSVDWRERVAGEAEPGSGIAATLSTQF